MTTPPARLLHTGIPAATLSVIRFEHEDGFGHPLVPVTTTGGEVLRCCLTIARAGDHIALISYQPLSKGGPYAEVGPLFIHANDCDGYAATGAFPSEFAGRRAVLRPYDADGQMLDGVLAEPGDSQHLVADLLTDCRVDVVQVRNVVAGCWNLDVRRDA